MQKKGDSPKGSNDGKVGAIKETNQDEGDRDRRSLFVKNVHFSANKTEIEEHFRASGKV